MIWILFSWCAETKHHFPTSLPVHMFINTNHKKLPETCIFRQIYNTTPQVKKTNYCLHKNVFCVYKQDLLFQIPIFSFFSLSLSQNLTIYSSLTEIKGTLRSFTSTIINSAHRTRSRPRLGWSQVWLVSIHVISRKPLAAPVANLHVANLRKWTGANLHGLIALLFYRVINESDSRLRAACRGVEGFPGISCQGKSVWLPCTGPDGPYSRGVWNYLVQSSK